MWFLLLSAPVDRLIVLLSLCALAGSAAAAPGSEPQTPPTPQTPETLQTPRTPATLKVVPSGGWGEVLVDGVSQGLGPVRLELPPGRHLVELAETEHHVRSTREVLLSPGDELELVIARTLKVAWLEARGFPAGTWVQIDGGPGPLLFEGTRIVIADSVVHEFRFVSGGEVLRSLAVQRCVDRGCLLPGTVRVEAWDSAAAPAP